MINSGEACDDGNTVNNDTCSNTCQKTTCGDGVIEWPNAYGNYEQCDNAGLNSNTASCNTTCKNTICGDSIVQKPNGQGVIEDCDDGPGGTCPDTCISPLCGNGVINPGESCDGTNLNGKTCSNVAGGTFCSGSLYCFPPGHVNQCQFNISACIGCTNCPTGGSSPNSYTGCRANPPVSGNYSLAPSYTCLSGQQCYKCGIGYVWLASDNKCAVSPGWCGPTPSFLSPFTAHCGGIFAYTPGCINTAADRGCCYACLSGYDYDCTLEIEQY